MTERRKLILDILQNSAGHMTAEEVFFQAKKQMPGIVLATIYNNLNALSEQKLIMRIKTPDGADVFDKTTKMHGHAICKECGKLSDVKIEDLKNKIEEAINSKVEDYMLTVYYTCDKCKEKTI